MEMTSNHDINSIIGNKTLKRIKKEKINNWIKSIHSYFTSFPFFWGLINALLNNKNDLFINTWGIIIIDLTSYLLYKYLVITQTANRSKNYRLENKRHKPFFTQNICTDGFHIGFKFILSTFVLIAFCIYYYCFKRIEVPIGILKFYAMILTLAYFETSWTDGLFKGLKNVFHKLKSKKKSEFKNEKKSFKILFIFTFSYTLLDLICGWKNILEFTVNLFSS